MIAQGYCDDYIFRVDEELFVDATKKGGLARFANHCCDGNCYSRIIKAGGRNRIVLYSKERIEVGLRDRRSHRFRFVTSATSAASSSAGRYVAVT